MIGKGEKGMEKKGNEMVNENGNGKAKEVAALEEESAQPVSFKRLFRFADKTDKILLVVGIVLAAGNGVLMPLFSIVLGGLFDGINNTDDVKKEVTKYAKYFCYLAVAAFIASFAQVGLFTIAAERQAIRIRQAYLDAVLSQDIAWFDFRRSGELAAKIAENTVVIKDSMGDKLGALFQFGAMFIGGFAVGFAYSWKLTLVICSLAPMLALGGAIMMKVMTDMTGQGLNAYSKAGAIADEALANFRTVTAFGAQRKIEKLYEKLLSEAEQFGLKKSLNQGLGMGFTMFVMFACYGLAFAYGAILVEKDRKAFYRKYPTVADPVTCTLDNFPFVDTMYDLCASVPDCLCGCRNPDADCIEGGDVVLVFFSVIMGSFAIGQAAPSISALKSGQVSAGKIFSIIDRKPAIDSTDTAGGKPESLTGKIAFKNVTFAYPTRPELKILDDFNLDIDAGKSTALVGGSGCGKSTVIALLQRFYDPLSGNILVDEYSLRSLNLSFWRNQIGYVGQEPVLFATSIAKNISYGAESGKVATHEEIIAAAKAANAYDFIMSFPQQFDTLVGERGAQLSGGQKQRIAIARAILRDPSFLLLDEATSALDNESEKVVQKALDELLLQKKRTTIVIAHRLSTVRNCDKIVVLGAGKVIEEGSHEDLMKLENGAYNMLVTAANKSQEKHYQDTMDNATDDIKELINRASKNMEDTKEGRKLSSNNKIDMLRESSLKKSKSNYERANNESKPESLKTSKTDLYKVPMRRVLSFAKGSYCWFFPGVVSAVLNGAQMPVFSLLFAEIVTVLYEPDTKDSRDGARLYAWLFVGLGLVAFLSNFGQFFCFGLIGEKMTKRVRGTLFHTILKQECAFFDEENHSIGALTSGLAGDAALVKASICDRLGLAVMNISTMILGLGIAFWKGWKLTLVLLAIFPLVALAGAGQLVLMTGMSREDDKYMAPAAQVLQESVAGIRTVSAFNSRNRVVKLYADYLAEPNKLGVKKGFVGGIGFAVSNAILFFMYAVSFYYGGILISRGEYTFNEMLTVFFAMVMTAMGLGQSVSLTPDVAKGGVAVSNVFKIVDRPSKIDYTSSDGIKLEGDKKPKGNIMFNKVSFNYPARPDATIFDKFQLQVEPGKTVALVGSSGSGKSTVVSLLERFYDPLSGEISLDDISDIRKINVTSLRSQMGLVEQEPRLFATSIKENIAYGSVDPVTDEQIIEAAKRANAHDFIVGFPSGYETLVGDQGAQLSGGQKQRICIARAIIRRPKILLLDEATSALDNESERIVQKAIDELVASETMTTIVVAHRLTTIQNADKIVVMAHGSVVETGRHEELINLNGPYSKLWHAQLKQEN